MVNYTELFQYLYPASFIILYNDQQMHTIISQIITLLHVSTLSYHPQTACNQYFVKLQQVFQMQLLVTQFTINPLKTKCVLYKDPVRTAL